MARLVNPLNMLLFRSLLFTIFMALSAVVYATPIVLLGWFWRRLPWRCAHGWVRVNLAVLRMLCGLDYQITGRENIPSANTVVFLKHQSAWETLAQIAIFPEQSWVLKRELFRIPFFGWALALLQPIAIDRRRSRQALRQVLRQGRERLARGLWVMVFPEGTRVAPGTTRRYGTSGALLAVETGSLVVPVAHNAGDFWPRRGLIKRPGTIRVRIGPPIATQGRMPAEVCALAQSWIETQMREISPSYSNKPLHPPLQDST